MKPITRTNEDLNKELIEETARRTAENVKKSLFEEGSTGSGSKITQILKNAGKTDIEKESEKEKEKEKQKELEKQKEIEKQKETEEKQKELEKQKEKERIEREKEVEKIHKELEESQIDCPTCSTHEHKHTLKRVGANKMKCVGDKCGIEYNLVPQPTKDDYKCTTCGLPHKRPLTKELEETDECPLCGNKEFIKFNWDKVITRMKRNK